MAQKRCYYEILGVTRTATEVEIQKAYRGLAKRYHPDQNPGDTEIVAKYHEVTEAYEVLRDPDKRQTYDRYGHQGLENGGGGRTTVDLSEFLDMFGFGGGRRRSRGPQRGADIDDVLDLDLLEAATGVSKTISLKYQGYCRECNGSGAKPGTQPTPCRRCKGTGAETVPTGGLLSIFTQTCRACNGRGVVIPNPCPSCRQGRIELRETFTIDIPAGVDTRMRVPIQGRGHEGAPGAPRGNLTLIIRVREHKDFERDGHNLICQCPISFARAALGGPVELTTLTGQKITIEVPRGSQTNTVRREPGHGMPDVDDPRRKGDLLVILVVETPTNLTAEQEELFHKLAELEGTNVSSPRKGLFGKLKDLISGENPQKE